MTPAEPEASGGPESPGEESGGGEDQELYPPPPASFEVLVSMLFSQATIRQFWEPHLKPELQRWALPALRAYQPSLPVSLDK